MEPGRLRCMVVVPDGTSRRVGANGLVIGRQQDCDIVALDPSVSRRHVLVRVATDGVEVVPLGRAPFAINGKSVDKPQPINDGDQLAVPGLVVTLVIELARPDPRANSSYLLERNGSVFGVVHTPFVIGGGATDDLVVGKWPPQVLRLHVAQDELFVELAAGAATRNGEPLAIGELIAVLPGDAIGCRGEVFHVRAPVGPPATTAVGGSHGLPSHVEIEMLPRGGRVQLRVGGQDAIVYLADRRLDLMMALLDPPEGYVAGEFIPDDVVRAKVWAKHAAVTRQEINTLISRCRRDLVEAGLAGPRLLERAPGGGGTRLQLAPGATVVVR
ncbi:MAG: FHA domain-containing protein [Proteobacteria bacterium]|nr:FHA domain-containing protein [Pseudomonadota bacterium]